MHAIYTSISSAHVGALPRLRDLIQKTKCVVQGSRPELLPERLLGSVRFSRLDLKTAIPLNPNDYPDDMLDPLEVSPPPSPDFPVRDSANGALDTSHSLQSVYSMRSGSGSGSNGGQESGHLDNLRFVLSTWSDHMRYSLGFMFWVYAAQFEASHTW